MCVPSRFRQGFTLIELLVVIAIVGILAAGSLIVLNPMQKINDAQDASHLADIKQINDAIQGYYAHNSAYPTKLDDLVTDGELKTVPKDPKCDSDPASCYKYITDTSNNSPSWYAVYVHTASVATQLPNGQNTADGRCYSVTQKTCRPVNYNDNWACLDSGQSVDCGAISSLANALPETAAPTATPTTAPTATPTPTPPLAPCTPWTAHTVCRQTLLTAWYYSASSKTCGQMYAGCVNGTGYSTQQDCQAACSGK